MSELLGGGQNSSHNKIVVTNFVTLLTLMFFRVAAVQNFNDNASVTEPLGSTMTKKLLLSAAIAAVCGSSISYADGLVEGRITDVADGLSLAGAVVRIDELNREVLVGSNGRFRIPSLSAGSYTLQVKLSNEEVESRTIEVVDDETTSVNIALNSGDQAVEEVLVIGQAAQIQRALDRQRNADNMISAINSDAIGQLPDNNAAEALQRVPGLSIERDQGEGRFVRVRGISPDLNSVTVNGTQLPAPEGGRRAVALDVMPADLINSLVVTKTLTPDMDANSIGGSIEVESLSALDRDGAFYTARAEASYDEHTDQTSPVYAVTAGNTFEFSGGERLGIAGAFSTENRKFGSDNVETGGKWKFEDGEEPALEEIQMRDYSIERDRIGAALNLDLELDMNNSFFLRTLYSEYTDAETRQKTEVGFGELDDEDEFDGKERKVGETGLAEVKRELKDREETQKIVSATFGGEHFVDDWTIEYAVGFSKAEEDEPGGISAAEFELNDDVVGEEYLNGIGFTNSKKPKIIAGNDFYDAASYKLDGVEIEKAFVEDKQNSIKFDITRDFDIADHAALVKFGAKSSQRKKTENEDVELYEDFADDSLTAYVSGTVDYDLGRYGPEISPSKIRSAISGAELQDDDEGKSIAADNEIEENINAAYVMGRIDIDDLRVLAGVRHEQTNTNLKGSKVNFYEDDAEEDQLDITKVDTDNNFSHTLPSLHIRYQLADSTQVRAAWTNTIVRPTFEQMSPSFSQEGLGDDAEAEKGNPELKTMESSNFDLGIEHFTGTAGVLSAFVFNKSIDNFIFQTDLAGTSGFENFSKVETYRNGDIATITGLELAFSQKLEMLPAPFNGLLISANSTISESYAKVVTFKKDDDAVEKITRDISMPNQSDVTGNFILGFEQGPLMLRLAANYKSEYLLEVQDVEEKTEDLYQGAQTQFDFSAAYAITDQVKVNFEIANFTDEPYYAYQNKEKYNSQYEDYGPTYRLGISYTSF